MGLNRLGLRDELALQPQHTQFSSPKKAPTAGFNLRLAVDWTECITTLPGGQPERLLYYGVIHVIIVTCLPAHAYMHNIIYVNLYHPYILQHFNENAFSLVLVCLHRVPPYIQRIYPCNGNQ